MEDIKRRMRSYSSEFKQEAVQLALSSSSPISATAKGLGIPVATLHSWIHSAKFKGKHTADADNNINVEEVLAENKNLRKRLSRLEQEKAILKKAAAYFAKELG